MKAKTILNFHKPRGVYDVVNRIYVKRKEVSQKKEILRMNRRMNQINRYDPEETKEAPIESITNPKYFYF